MHRPAAAAQHANTPRACAAPPVPTSFAILRQTHSQTPSTRMLEAWCFTPSSRLNLAAIAGLPRRRLYPQVVRARGLAWLSDQARMTTEPLPRLFLDPLGVSKHLYCSICQGEVVQGGRQFKLAGCAVRWRLQVMGECAGRWHGPGRHWPHDAVALRHMRTRARPLSPARNWPRVRAERLARLPRLHSTHTRHARDSPCLPDTARCHTTRHPDSQLAPRLCACVLAANAVT